MQVKGTKMQVNGNIIATFSKRNQPYNTFSLSARAFWKRYTFRAELSFSAQTAIFRFEGHNASERDQNASEWQYNSHLFQKTSAL